MQFIGTKSIVTETATWSKFPNGSKGIVEQILVSEDSKEQTGLGESQSGIRVGTLIIWVRSFEIEKL